MGGAEEEEGAAAEWRGGVRSFRELALLVLSAAPQDQRLRRLCALEPSYALYALHTLQRINATRRERTPPPSPPPPPPPPPRPSPPFDPEGSPPKGQRRVGAVASSAALQGRAPSTRRLPSLSLSSPGLSDLLCPRLRLLLQRARRGVLPTSRSSLALLRPPVVVLLPVALLTVPQRRPSRPPVPLLSLPRTHDGLRCGEEVTRGQGPPPVHGLRGGPPPPAPAEGKGREREGRGGGRWRWVSGVGSVGRARRCEWRRSGRWRFSSSSTASVCCSCSTTVSLPCLGPHSTPSHCPTVYPFPTLSASADTRHAQLSAAALHTTSTFAPLSEAREQIAAPAPPVSVRCLLVRERRLFTGCRARGATETQMR